MSDQCAVQRVLHSLRLGYTSPVPSPVRRVNLVTFRRSAAR